MVGCIFTNYKITDVDFIELHHLQNQYKIKIKSKKYSTTVKLGYIKLGFYEYMVYIEVLSRPEHNPIDFHVK